MDISEVGASAPVTWGSTGAALVVAMITIRRWMSRDKVDRSLDAATVQLIQSLQAERDAANKRADAADTRADAAIKSASELQTEVALLRFQVKTLSEQVAILTGKPNPQPPADISQ